MADLLYILCLSNRNPFMCTRLLKMNNIYTFSNRPNSPLFFHSCQYFHSCSPDGRIWSTNKKRLLSFCSNAVVSFSFGPIVDLLCSSFDFCVHIHVYIPYSISLLLCFLFTLLFVLFSVWSKLLQCNGVKTFCFRVKWTTPQRCEDFFKIFFKLVHQLQTVNCVHSV